MTLRTPISFIDGQSYKILARDLTKHGLDPRTYRERYGLPEDYPMVAQSYSEKRIPIAMCIGSGWQAQSLRRHQALKL